MSDQTAQSDDNKEILGVTTATVLSKQKLNGESQEKALRRAYEEMAYKAGISDEKAPGEEKSPKQLFIEERIKANKDTDDVVRINNSNNENKKFSDAEWADLRTITISPSEGDIEALKKYKAQDSYNQGVKAAQTLKEAMNRGYNFGDLFNKVGGLPPDVEKAIQTIKTNEGNINFQDGVITTLDADDFVKTEKYLAGTKYEGVLRNTLSITGSDLKAGKARFKQSADIQNLQKQIAQKADSGQLGRLVGDENKPMAKTFWLKQEVV